ncbi:MAG TPA: exopolysaccharide biosynthesis protein [Candidatus Sulfotelmatobacter sp.]|nr:exopolysaccharide biosynthesis protein [Candidatus Sulfotelmatobacter sp.]
MSEGLQTCAPSQEAEHQPLSRSLAALLAQPASAGSWTLNRLLERTQGRGLYLVVILLASPFIVPVSLPGLSPVLGSIIAWLMLRLALGKPPRLPRFLGERQLPPAVQQRVLGGSVRCLHWLERVARPRHTQWLGWRLAQVLNCGCIGFLALLLALPLPAPPFFFTNSVPSYGIIVLAASLMEEDGVLIWWGYALLAANMIFFGLLAGAITEVLLKAWQVFGHSMSGL